MSGFQSVYPSDADQFYYNVNIPYSAPPVDAIQVPTQAKFSETRRIPIVKDPSNWALAVERFSIPASSIPVLLWELEDSTVSVNTGSYAVRMKNRDNTIVSAAPTFMEWETQDETAPVPVLGPNQDFSSSYYFCQQYEHFVKLLNEALVAQTAAYVVAGGPVATTAPWFQYDANSHKLTLVAAQAEYDDALLNPIEIYVNTELFHLVQGIYEIKFEDDFGTQNSGFNYQLQVVNFFDNAKDDYIHDPGTVYLLMEQNYETLANWQAVRTIVIQTSFVPVNPEYLQLANSLSQVTNSNFSQKALADFELPLDLFAVNRSAAQYNRPAGDIRRIALQSSEPLSTFDIAIFWQDITGTLRPLTLSKGESATIKFSFTLRYDNVVAIDVDAPQRMLAEREQQQQQRARQQRGRGYAADQSIYSITR